MTNSYNNNSEEIMAAVAAYNGYQVYKQTGDTRQAAIVGFKSYGYMALTSLTAFVALVCWLVITVDTFSGYWYGYGVTWLVAVVTTWLTVWLWRCYKRMYNKPFQQAHNAAIMPPAVPGMPSAPAPAPRPRGPQPQPSNSGHKPGEVTYDLKTGRFIKW